MVARWAVLLLLAGFLVPPGAAAEKAEKEKKPAEKKEASPESSEKATPKPKEKEKEKGKEPEATPRPPTPQSVLHEVAAYTRLSKEAAEQGKWPLTDHFLQKMVDLPATDEEKKSGLIEIAKTYELHEDYPKAIAMYEKINTLFVGASDHAQRLLDLGRLYRKLGANDLAISRFYNVLNASLTLGEGRLDSSRSLTQQAQKEIADTYFQLADYKQAHRFYDLLSRLDLTGEEKAGVQFRLFHCLYLLGEITKAGAAAQQFLEDFPDSASAPEARYLLAMSLRALDKPKEAYENILVLVRDQDKDKDKGHPPEKRVYWQKKAGNEFANDLYQKGEYLQALNIYQSLATIDESPDWQWPVIYQMGLCFEKLRIERRAAEAYKFILDESKKPGREVAKLSQSSQNLIDMARWRGEQLVWKNGITLELDHILGSPTDAQAVANKPISFR